ncbi:GIY-YIG nuclease family protein [Streptomyces sp. SAI-127]|uniref:GIY-YIG nuclease family protein n=1 Tax=Streptomyces sp. SAI-127 TaxID=2940543 RepID=UPI0024733E62|nr:GIY-YIG nuclease family protein [Streptomyces sp. SAI-127]MDH6489698.1 transposase-like protein [Streptomyces sp. SAI-127]
MHDPTAEAPAAECWRQVAEAYVTDAWQEFGYATWAEYLAGEWDLGELSADQQRAIAQLLYDAGMPMVAIAVTLRVNRRLVPQYVQGRSRRGAPPAPELPDDELEARAGALYGGGMPMVDIAATLRVNRQRLPALIPARGRRGTPYSAGVYVIGSPQFRPVKIGKGNPAERLAELQTGNPFPLVILWTGPGELALEQALHARFAAYRVRGEWFEFPADQDPVAAVAQAAQELAAVA